ERKSGEPTNVSAPGVRVALPEPLALKAVTVNTGSALAAGRGVGGTADDRGGSVGKGGKGGRSCPVVEPSLSRTEGASSARYTGRAGPVAPVSLAELRPWSSPVAGCSACFCVLFRSRAMLPSFCLLPASRFAGDAI